ncbi:HNH endonuclease family protein [Moorena producens]|uniref:HNH endonuclease family protein n=1 Tax=Moorena producens TaxID=1155739 RepID=UPI003C754744
MGASGIEGSYSKAARAIFEANNNKKITKIRTELKEQMLNKIPSKNIFNGKFKELKYVNKYTKNKKLIQYILFLIEVSKRETKELKPDDMTLEHILSQSSGNDDCIGKIGNLLPLAKDLNQKADNKSFKEKIEIYQESEFHLTREFVANNYQTWGEEQINERTNELADYCYDLVQNQLESS